MVILFMLKLAIKTIRKTKGVTQEELSLRTGLSQSYLSELEKSDSLANPTLKTIETIAEALNVCPIDLISCDCKEHL